MHRTRIAVALAAALIGGHALAQSSASGASPATSPTTTAPAAATAPAANGTFVTEQGVGEFRASKFVGLNVYGSDNQKIGNINEILIDGTGAAKAVVIGVGGFLGIGEKDVAVPFASLEWINSPASTASASAGAGAGSGAMPATSGNVGAGSTLGTAPTVATAPTLGAAPSSGAAPGLAPAATGSTTPARSPAETAAYNGYPDHAMLRVTKAQVQDAPVFKYYAQTQSNAAPKP